MTDDSDNNEELVYACLAVAQEYNAFGVCLFEHPHVAVIIYVGLPRI